VLSERTWERRFLKKEIRRLSNKSVPEVDFGAEFVPICRAANDETDAFRLHGADVKFAGPVHKEGGRLHTLSRRFLSATADRPRFYYAKSQTVPLMFGDRSSEIRRMVVIGSMGAGKCLAPDTPVLLHSGEIVRADAIQAGDQLMGPDSEPRTVLSTCTGTDRMYRIVPSRGDSFVCNEPHVLTIYDNRDETLKDVPLNEFLKWPQWRKNQARLQRVPVSFPEPKTELQVDPWLAGLWYADGRKDLSIVEISNPEEPIAEVLAEVAQENGFELKAYHSPACPQWRIVGPIGRKNALLDSMRLLYGNGERLPARILRGRRTEREAFLAGYIDGDGYNAGTYVEIVSKHEAWAKDLAFLARSLGFAASVREKSVRLPGWKEPRVYHRVSITGDFSSLPLVLERKRPCTSSMRWRQVTFKVESIGEGTYFGFQLDRDGRFLLGDFTITHNTEVMARWLLRTAFRFRNAAIGVVAPTQSRRDIIWRKLLRLLRPAWIAEVRLSDKEIHLVNGVRFEFVSAKENSAATGSPLAGKDWVAAGVDEEQDCPQSAMDELEMRGRDAPDGYFPVLSTCTLKDSAEWRERKQRYEAQPDCSLYRMTLTDNPFVAQAYIDSLARSLDPRAYRMRVLALDTRPERATYPDFSRERHVRQLPELGVRDITKSRVGASALIGYDPGTLKDCSVILKCFSIAGGPPTWFVMSEVVTEPGSAQKHAADLVSHLALDYALQPRDVIIRADPYGDTPTENKPDRTVYVEFRIAGFKILPAVHKRNPTAKTANKPGSLPRNARISVVNRLLLNQANETRIYLLADDQGLPVAKEVANSLEVSARDESGKAENYRKDKYDPTHPTAALGYALYSYEKPRLTELEDYGAEASQG